MRQRSAGRQAAGAVAQPRDGRGAGRLVHNLLFAMAFGFAGAIVLGMFS